MSQLNQKPMPVDNTSAEQSPKLKTWVTPQFERAAVAERTNKKTILPSDGFGAHQIS